VSDALSGGDTAAARAQAEELLTTIDAAVDAGDVPAALAGELRAAAERLLGLIESEEPAPSAPAETDEGKDEGKGKAKGHDRDKKPKPGEATDTTGTTGTTDTTDTTDTTGTTP